MKRVSVYQISIVILLLLAIIIPLSVLIPKKNINLDQPILIYSDEDFLKYDFNGEGTESDPYLIEEETIIQDSYGERHHFGIYIENTTKYFTIKNCIIKDYSYGIVITSVANGTAKILDNFLEHISYYAIYNVATNESVIENNIMTWGIEIGIYVLFSNNCSVNNNTIYDIVSGILVIESHFTSLINNNCSYNSNHGIRNLFSNQNRIEKNVISHIQSDSSISKGIEIAFSSHLTICNNSITENHIGIDTLGTYYSTFEMNNISYNKIFDGFGYGDGIFMEGSANNTIKYNFFRENGEFGLNILESDNNTIHHNAFIRNNHKIVDQAFEESCTGNVWYEGSTLQGNHWQEWNTSLVYEIGGGLSVDLYPLDVNPVNFMLVIYQIRISFKYAETLNLL